jgi:hypothetical protein
MFSPRQYLTTMVLMPPEVRVYTVKPRGQGQASRIKIDPVLENLVSVGCLFLLKHGQVDATEVRIGPRSPIFLMAKMAYGPTEFIHELEQEDQLGSKLDVSC